MVVGNDGCGEAGGVAGFVVGGDFSALGVSYALRRLSLRLASMMGVAFSLFGKRDQFADPSLLGWFVNSFCKVFSSSLREAIASSRAAVSSLAACWSFSIYSRPYLLNS